MRPVIDLTEYRQRHANREILADLQARMAHMQDLGVDFVDAFEVAIRTIAAHRAVTVEVVLLAAHEAMQ